MTSSRTLTPPTEASSPVDGSPYRALIGDPHPGPGARLVRAGLRVASLPYAAAVALRGRAFDAGVLKAERLDRPVISVGNLTAGGTGKTPIVEAIARRLGADRKVAVLLRGYAPGADEGEDADEVRVLRENLPDARILPGADRVARGRRAIEEGGVDVFILDDGFQHRRLARDLDLVVIDALCPFGFGHLLPRGLLREPLSGLRRADLIAISRVNQVAPGEVEALRSRLAGIHPEAPIVEVAIEPTLIGPRGGEEVPAGEEPLRDVPVHAFSGIGNPASFARTLEALGGASSSQAFPDHHRYTDDDRRRIVGAARRVKARALVTTQKDAVKLRDWQPEIPLWVVRIRAMPGAGAEELDRRLQEVAS